MRNNVNKINIYIIISIKIHLKDLKKIRDFCINAIYISTMTSEPRGMAGKGGSGSEGVMGEEGVMEWTVGAFIF